MLAFMRVSGAYDQVKDGIWVPKGDGSGQGAGSGDRYANFRYTTSQSRGTRSYEDFYKEMHTGRTSQADDGDTGADPKKNYVGSNPRVQAWFRLILAWSVTFVMLRVALLVAFPPGLHNSGNGSNGHGGHQGRKKPPPPKPLPGMQPLQTAF